MNAIERYRRWYARLLRFYPTAYRQRFGEGMEQTFNDLLRERRQTGSRTLTLVLWVFGETAAGIMKENVTAMTPKVKRNLVLSVIFLGMLAILATVYAINGFDDAWLYLSAAFVVACSFWSAFRQGDSGQP